MVGDDGYHDPDTLCGPITSVLLLARVRPIERRFLATATRQVVADGTDLRRTAL